MPVSIVKSDEEILTTYTLMKQLRPHLKEETYLSKIKHLQLEYGYKLIVIFENGVAKAAAGYRICDSLAWGKYLYVDDLITDQESRSSGYGKQLFDLLDEELLKNQCDGMHLDSGVQRHDAHRFYLNRKMKITCHHFEKSY
ncbi:GNAT family N-acetyltransferase [Cohnella abietis]|uniref:N-acetyltransferase GCN5 n=1 Tax=Cohnella abietis TaxID=2507935 RepID=A0A3T1D7J6_9BACL|nr:GNAT family N-acetyltransferase [Cohnella abietis]BBI34019.1 N-acetyltransferase GCN5 [Cohnella abietis]